MALSTIPTDPEAIMALSQLDPEYQIRLEKRGKLPRMAGPIVSYRDMITTIQKATLPRLPTSVSASEISIPMRDGETNRAIVYSPAQSDVKDAPLIVLIHGGGRIVGLPEIEQSHAVDSVTNFDAVCISISYRLAPEDPFPTAAEDAIDAVGWIAANYSSIHPAIAPNKGFIVGGSSAGGALSDIIIHHYRDVGLTPRITGAWVINAQLIDYRTVPAEWKSSYLSWEQNKDSDLLGREDIEYYTDMNLPDPDDVLHAPFLDPKGHVGLPPIALQVAGCDPFRDDGLIYGRVLQELEKQGKAKLRIRIWKGVPHMFEAVETQLQRSKECKADGIETIRWLLEQSAP